MKIKLINEKFWKLIAENNCYLIDNDFKHNSHERITSRDEVTILGSGLDKTIIRPPIQVASCKNDQSVLSTTLSTQNNDVSSI